MRIKSFSHYTKLLAQRRGRAFAVLGYPRSGTTMLSELVGMVTSYYFDRNNTLPVTGLVVLHSHWAPARFRPSHAVYIVRDPVAVARSVINFHAAGGWGEVTGNPLAVPLISRIPWADHVTAAIERGIHIVDYDRLMAREPATLDRLAERLGARSAWLASSLDILSDKHRVAPHETDARIMSHRERSGEKGMENLEERLAREIAIYRDLQATIGAHG